MNKYGIKKVDNPRAHRDSRNYSSSKRKKSNKSSASNKSNSQIVVIPLDSQQGRSIQRGMRNRDGNLANLLDDLALAVNSNRFKDGSFYYGDGSDEFASDESDEGDLSEDSSLETDELQEGFTSESDNE